MIVMMVINLIHAFILLEAAWYLHSVTLVEWQEKSEAPLTMINVPETLFWSDDAHLNAEIMSHEFQKPKGYKPRFYNPATQCLLANETTRCPEGAIEGHHIRGHGGAGHIQAVLFSLGLGLRVGLQEGPGGHSIRARRIIKSMLWCLSISMRPMRNSNLTRMIRVRVKAVLLAIGSVSI